MTREEAAEELEFALDIAYKIAWNIEHKIFIRKIKRKENLRRVDGERYGQLSENETGQ